MSQSLVDFIRYLPVPALVPLTIIWLGIGESSKIALLWIGTFFQLVLLVADDARRVPREYIEIGLTTGAKPRQILRDIVLPAMLPSMVDNLRITLGWCWTYLIIAEIVAADSGIGYVIMSARRYVKTDEVMAGILTIGDHRPCHRPGDPLAASPLVRVSGVTGMAHFPRDRARQQDLRRQWRAPASTSSTTSRCRWRRARSWSISVRPAAASPRSCAWWAASKPRPAAASSSKARR